MLLFFRSLFLLSLASAFVNQTALAGDFLRPTAKIERGPSRKIRLSITFARLTLSDLGSLEIQNPDSSAARDALIKFLDICLPTNDECGSSFLKARYFQNPELDRTLIADQSTTILAEIDGGSILVQKDTTAESWTIKADILLSSSDSNVTFDSSTKISTKIIYGNPSITETENAINTTFGLGIKQVPQDPYSVSSKQALTVVWTQLDQVQQSDDTLTSATGMLAILVPITFINSAQTLPSHLYNIDFNKQSTTPDSTCSISINGEACNVTCAGDQDQFIAEDDLEGFSSSGIQTKSVTVSQGNAITFTQLESTEKYAIILQYLDDGLRRSCTLGTPNEAITLVQVETGKEPKIGDSSCFIATVAYGSPLDKHLTSLRWFRDQLLLTSPIGIKLVNVYYTYGPRAAQWMTDKPLLKAAVRGLLWVPVKLIESFHTFSNR